MRELLVQGEKRFKVTIPDDAKVTFGPFSPPSKDRSESYGPSERRGTLRIYRSHKSDADILAVFSGVTGFRDLAAVEYIEEAFVTKGQTVWQNDQNGYSVEDRASGERQWVVPELPPEKRL